MELLKGWQEFKIVQKILNVWALNLLNVCYEILCKGKGAKILYPKG